MFTQNSYGPIGDFKINRYAFQNRLPGKKLDFPTEKKTLVGQVSQTNQKDGRGNI